MARADGISSSSRSPDNDQYCPEPSHLQEVYGRLDDHSGGEASDLPGTSEAGIAIEDTVNKPGSDKQVYVPLKNVSTATSFELCLRTWNGDPILVKNMSSNDTVHDLKMRIQNQQGIPLNMQRVFSADRELKDGTSTSPVGCTLYINIDYKQNTL